MTDEAKTTDDEQKVDRLAPGAELWEKSIELRGRPPVFEAPEQLEDEVFSYLQWVKDNPLVELKAFGTGLILRVPKKRYPTASGCAMYCGVTPRAWRHWKAKGHHLKDVVEWAEEMMLQIKMEGAASGFFNSTIVARDVGLKDKSEVAADLTINVIDNFDGENDDDE